MDSKGNTAYDKRKKRCPWCGKLICDNGSILSRLRSGLSPVSICKSCFNAFSSSLSSSILMFLILIVWFYFTGTLLEFIIILSFLILSVTLAILLSLFGIYGIYKLDLNGKKVKEDGVEYIGIIDNKGDATISKNAILLTDKALDESPEFSVVSPIKINKYSRKSGMISFSFIYEHPDNSSLVERSEFEVYSLIGERYESFAISGVARKDKKNR